MEHAPGVQRNRCVGRRFVDTACLGNSATGALMRYTFMGNSAIQLLEEHKHVLGIWEYTGQLNCDEKGATP